MTNKNLIIGYGNPDRQDDGVAWHVLQAIANTYGFQINPETGLDQIQINSEIEIKFMLQLVPELSEHISKFTQVCFLDAHTGAIPEEVRAISISPQFHPSPFTHHLTPESLLEICQTIYKKTPRAFLVSIRGYEFGFSNQLSPQTAKLVEIARDHVLKWLKE